MKRPRSAFAGGLLAGTLIGLVLGTSAVSLAEFKKSGWQRFNGMFRAGYVAGFNDAIRIAKHRAAGSYLDTGFKVPMNAKVSDWLKTINRLYEKKEYEHLAVSQLIQLAGEEMMEEFGPDASTARLAQLQGFIAQRQAAATERLKQRKAAEAEMKAKGIEPPDPREHPKVKMMEARRETLELLGLDEDYWDDTGSRLKKGYITGFNDCVYVAELTEPESFVASNYTRADVDYKRWRRALNNFYGDLSRQSEPRLVAMAHAGRAVAAKHGAAALQGDKAAAQRAYLEKALSEDASKDQPGDD